MKIAKILIVFVIFASLLALNLLLTANPLDDISNLRKVKMVFKDGVLIDLNHPQGTASYWDYYITDKQKKGFLADAEKAAGFNREN